MMLINQVIAQADWRAGSLRGHTVSDFDYDGCMKVTIQLSQVSKKKIESMELVIPLDAQQASDPVARPADGERALHHFVVVRGAVLARFIRPHVVAGLAVLAQGDAGALRVADQSMNRA